MRKLLGILALWFCTAFVYAHPGVGIVEDSRGNVFFTDLKQVWQITPDGKKSVAVPDVHTHELCVDRKDNLFGEHLWYEGDATQKWGHRVWRLSPNGKLTDVIPSREGFLDDYSFVRDQAGNMYWANRGEKTVVKKRSSDGKLHTHAAGDFRDVRWMTATPAGTLFLIDGGDLKRISSDGKVTAVAAKLSAHEPAPSAAATRHYQQGLWTDREGNVYVATTAERLVLKVGPDGAKTVVARSGESPKPAPGLIDQLDQSDQLKDNLLHNDPESWAPTGGMFDRRGNLWLLEYSSRNAVRAKKIGRDGKERVY
jgi:hypothetical protein